jgi:ADP-ribosyl-[dinitrogen reductase] hydrolase
MKKKIISALFGIAVGDALGVPVEFDIREDLQVNLITEMTGYRTHNQPLGTWSDDSSLSFCLAEALIGGFDLNRIAENFVKWYKNAYWTPHNEVFDIGGTTRIAIQKIQKGEQPEMAGGIGKYDNGNGSLMRILPLLFYIKDKPIEERYRLTSLVSSITHRHIRSVIACFLYLEYARYILETNDKFLAFEKLQNETSIFINSLDIDLTELSYFDNILKLKINERDINEIITSSYVIHTLEASLWCFLNTDDYQSAVLKAVNLGEDADTTGAVTGGLAGLFYEVNSIPPEWLEVLVKNEEILDLAIRFSNSLE